MDEDEQCAGRVIDARVLSTLLASLSEDEEFVMTYPIVREEDIF